MTGLPCTLTILMLLKESAKHMHAYEESDSSAKHRRPLHQITPEQPVAVFGRDYPIH